MSTLPLIRDATGLPAAKVEIMTGAQLRDNAYWRQAFSNQRKDHRYYELLEETVAQTFEYRYFAIRDTSGAIRTILPFFLLDQSLLAGLAGADRVIAPLRRFWPKFLSLRTLMVGCAAGEAHLDEGAGTPGAVPLLARRIRAFARGLGAQLIVLKEFPAKYRAQLQCFEQAGFKRIASMPMTLLRINYASFDDYLAKALGKKTRQDLRRKLRRADHAAPIEMAVARDVTPAIDEIYPLYLQVFQRSPLKFEKLTPEFFCRLGQTMPDKARFFLWRQDGRLIAFALCLVQGDEVFAEYLGLDYRVALDLHLYHYVTRDVINWAISNGYQSFRSSGLNYDPKLHMRHVLDPLDLYVRHTNPVFNAALRLSLPFMAPVRYDPTLPKFPNYDELWGNVDWAREHRAG